MDIPLCLLVFGDEGLQPALIASLIVICLLFALAAVVSSTILLLTLGSLLSLSLCLYLLEL